MWGIVLWLGLTAAPDPLRIAITVFLVSRPRPMINLLAFWLGGMVTGIAYALAALVLLRDFLPIVVHHAISAAGTVTGGHTKLVIGVLALSIAAVNTVQLARQRSSAPIGISIPLAPVRAAPTAARSTPRPLSRLVSRAWRSLEGGRPWVAFVVGLGQGPAPVEFVAAVSVIQASGAAVGTQLSAAVAFTVAMFAIVELPLVSFIVRPAHTETIVLSVHNWLRTHRQQIFTVGAGVLGIVMVASG